MARVLVSLWRRLQSLFFNLCVCELFFFHNVKNFRPNQCEQQFCCATGRFFERKSVIKGATEAV